MKIGFLLNTQCHILSVFQQPVSEAVASATFLAMQLAKMGHDITMFSDNANNFDAFGVRGRILNIKDGALNLDKAILETDFHALIFVNDSPAFAASIKQALPYRPKIILWTAHDPSLPINASLKQPEIVREIDKIICVSEWQRARILEGSNIFPDKIQVIHNAISIFFEDLFLDGKEFEAAKPKQPHLAYIGAPEDGLEIVFDTFPDLSGNYAAARLSVFSYFNPTAPTPEQVKLLEESKHLKGLAFLGMPPLLKYPALLKHCTLLAYPALHPATSYTNVLEALAAGVYPITSRAGALVEYCFGHGKNVAENNLRGDTLESFISQLLTICQTQVHSESAFFDYCYKQVVEINKKHTWRVRAREWTQLLST